MEIIQAIILVFFVFALSRVLINVKHRRIGRLEGLFWSLFWAAACLAAIFPNIIVSIATLVGVDRGVDLIVYGTLVILSYLIYRVYAQINGMEKKITKIIRTVAIKKKIEEK
jgi:hypothetical protein